MTHIAIKCRFTNKVLFEGEYESTRHAVEAAVKARADLARADLTGAHLAGADLTGAHLAGADLAGADLAGAYLTGADLAGADLAGAKILDETLVICPLQLYGLRWPVFITPKFMKIGCERHTHEDWKGYKRTEITQMAFGAWDWWRQHKGILLALCELHRAEAEKAAEAKAKEVA